MLSVREIQQKDIPDLLEYWLDNDPGYMARMGVDLSKLPSEDTLRQMLEGQLSIPYAKKTSYCIIWQREGRAIGHSNVNKILFGKSAFMHLHLWQSGFRQKGMGSQLVEMTLPYFFKNLELDELYCEPYAQNPAPNKTLEKLGFEFIKKYRTIPGSLNFEQEVNQWRITSPS